jgi:hypothetical protein
MVRVVLPRGFFWSLPAWAAVATFWFLTTKGFHPTTALAGIVTASLVIAAALAAYINHLVLIPRYWRAGRRGAYLAAILTTIGLVTAAALAEIRLSYFRLLGPDADPYGAYKHFAIDFSGVAIHVAAAAVVVSAARRFFRP